MKHFDSDQLRRVKKPRRFYCIHFVILSIDLKLPRNKDMVKTYPLS